MLRRLSSRPTAGIRHLALAVVLCLLLVLPAASASAETLTVSKSPTGSAGSVTSDPAGIDCGADCSEDYPQEEVCFENPHGVEICTDVPQSVTLTATATNGFAFNAWSGCDASSGSECTMSMSADKTATALYTDVSNPSVSLTEPSSGPKRGTIDLAASASDNWAVERVEFFLSGAIVASDSSAPYAATLNTAARPDGFYTVRARATDRASRITESVSRSIVIDNTAPTIGITGPDEATFGPGTTQSWTLDADGGHSGLASIECSVVAVGSPPSFGACSGGNDAHAVSGRPEGEHVFSVRARDGAGNETTASRQFSIVEPPPPNPPSGGGQVGAVLVPSLPPKPPQSPPPIDWAKNLTVAQRWTVSRGRTRVRKLAIKGLPKDAKVSVRCKGKDCPFKLKRHKARSGAVELTKLFKKRRLRPGTVIEVRVEAPDGSGVLYRYLTRQGGKRPKTLVLCIDPGSKPKRC